MWKEAERGQWRTTPEEEGRSKKGRDGWIDGQRERRESESGFNGWVGSMAVWKE